MRYARTLAVTFCILFVYCTGTLAAGEKIAVIDTEKFKQKSESLKDLLSEMQKKVDTMQKKLYEEQKALKELEGEFEKQRLMLSLDAQEDKRLELEKKKLYVKYLFEDFSMETKALEREAQKTITTALQKIVQDLGEKKGYSLILEKRTPGIYYTDKAIDITEEVIKLYDSQKR